MTFLLCGGLLFLDAVWLLLGGKAAWGEVGKKPFIPEVMLKNLQKKKEEEK